MTSATQEAAEEKTERITDDSTSGDTFVLTEELGKGDLSSAEYIQLRGEIVKPSNFFESFLIPALILFLEGIRIRLFSISGKGHAAK